MIRPSTMNMGEFDEGYVFALSGGGTSLVFEGLLFQTDFNGDLIWMKKIAPHAPHYAVPDDIIVYSDGGCLLATHISYTSVEQVLSRFDKDGDLLWARARSHDERNSFNRLDILSDGQLVGAGNPQTSDELLLARIPAEVPLGNWCPEIVITFQNHTYEVVKVNGFVGVGGEWAEPYIYPDSVVADTSGIISGSELTRTRYCGPVVPCLGPILNNLLLDTGN